MIFLAIAAPTRLSQYRKAIGFFKSSCSWSGLSQWRSAPINDNRSWGDGSPVYKIPTSLHHDDPRCAKLRHASSLSELGAIVLSTSDPLTKSVLSYLAFSRWKSENLPIGSHPAPPPSRPQKPMLVSPKEIPSLKDSGIPLNVYMLHNLAHVELNAIDLAWDTVVRFSQLRDSIGDGFFEDFARVADDESRHFAWCSQRLNELGYAYGDMPAHDMLWRECEKSSDDVAARLAVIPLVQEARGLDAGPRLVQKLVGFGDTRSSKIVARIADEEVAHVAVGVYWFVAICDKMGCAPSSTFHGKWSISLQIRILDLELLKHYQVVPKGPFNYAARDDAGLPRDWYENDQQDTSNNDHLALVRERLSDIISMECPNANSVNPPT